MSDPLEIGSQVIVSCLIWMLGIKFGSFANAKVVLATELRVSGPWV